MSTKQPVIIGSGIGGLLVSDQLSQAGVAHTVVASPPPDETSPRLGESINLHGSLALRKLYPQADAFFAPKKTIDIYLKRQKIVCDLEFASHTIRALAFRILGAKAPDELIHLDRARFDRFLYDRAEASPLAEFTLDRVSKVGTDGDKVITVELYSGQALYPNFVFDATNRGRVITEPLGIKSRNLSDLHRVAFTHFVSKNRQEILNIVPDDWAYATSIVRLTKEQDDVDAIGWCIPLRNRVSIGASLLDPATTPDEDLIQSTLSALARFGIDPLKYYPTPDEVIGLESSYFIMERSSGENWMLVGSAASNIWWPSGTGIGIALAAAELAPGALVDPIRARKQYDRYLGTLETMHRSVDGLLGSDSDYLDTQTFRRESVNRNLSEISRWLKMPEHARNPILRLTEAIRDPVLRPLLRKLKLCTISDLKLR